MPPDAAAGTTWSSAALEARFGAALRALLVALSAVSVSAYLYVALSRASYPFALEWVEPNVYLHVERVMRGEPLYGVPSYDFIPMIYTPLYYYLSAAVAWFTGPIMLSMRLVSIGSSLFLFAMLYMLSRTHQLSRGASLLAVGLFAAAYGLTGYWFDIGKADALFLALLLAAFQLAVVRTRYEKAAGCIAGLVLCLSFAAKQQALGAWPFLLLYLIIDGRWEKALCLGASFAVAASGFIWMASEVSQGWFLFYAFTVPSAIPISTAQLLEFWKTLALPRYAWLVAHVALALALGWPKKASYWLKILVLLLPLFGISLLSVAKQYGYVNGLLPSAAAFALLGAAAYHQADTMRHRSAPLRTAALSLAFVCLGAQFFSLRYSPGAQIPTRAQLRAGYDTLEVVRDAEPPVFVPTSPDLLSMAGRPTHYHASSLGDLVAAAKYDSDVDEVYQEHKEEVFGPLKYRLARTVLVPRTSWCDTWLSPEKGYDCQSLGFDGQSLTTIVGAVSSLTKICRSR